MEKHLRVLWNLFINHLDMTMILFVGVNVPFPTLTIQPLHPTKLSGTRDAENDRLRWAERHRLLRYSPLFHLFQQTHPRLRELRIITVYNNDYYFY
jgi:hypothetical protein